MHFMLLIFVFLLGAVLWGFFHANPRGVHPGRLLACNVAILALAALVAAASGGTLYVDALAAKPGERALSIYLGVMAGGSAFMIVVALLGLVRNFALFPLSRRELSGVNN
jgi:hypothetical protein